jgi:tetratricopeptide (TPR) repeat protein
VQSTVRKSPLRWTLRSTALTLAALQLLAIVVVYACAMPGGKGASTATSAYVLPLRASVVGATQASTAPPFSYTVFSTAHLRDLPNAYVLNGGAALFLFAGALCMRPRARRGDSPRVLVMATAAFSGFLVALTGFAMYGLARDWDLAALPVLPLLFLVSAMLVERDAEERFLPAFAPLVLALAVASILPWLRVNTDATASAKRFETILSGYLPTIAAVNSYVGYESLNKYHVTTKDSDGSIRVIKKMLSTGWMRMSVYRKLLRVVAGQPGAHATEFPWLMESLLADERAKYPRGHLLFLDPSELREYAAMLLIVPAFEGRSDIARRYLPRFRAALAPWPEGGLVDVVLDDAIPVADKFGRMQTMLSPASRNPELLLFVGDMARRAEQRSAAIRYYDRALAQDAHEFPNAYLMLADMWYREGRPDQALRVLERCADNCRFAPERATALEWIARIRREGATP